MATPNYGNSFGKKTVDPVGVERINVWDRTEEFWPGGGVLKKSATYKEGDIIPAGTVVTMTLPGGEATIGGNTPTGLTYEDVVMGSEFATLTIVVRGTFLESRSKATAVTAAQKTALKQIIFVKEL